MCELYKADKGEVVEVSKVCEVDPSVASSGPDGFAPAYLRI